MCKTKIGILLSGILRNYFKTPHNLHA